MAFKARSLEAKHFGSEPTYDDWEGFPDELLEQKIQDSFRWYYKFYDFKESLHFIVEYYKKNKVNNKNVKQIKPADLVEVGNHVGYIARMKTKGLKRLPLKYENLFIEKLKIIESIGSKRKEDKKDDSKPPPNIQKRIKEYASGLVFDIEEEVEKFIDNNCETSWTFKDFMKMHKISRPVCKHMVPMLETAKNEVVEAKKGDDKDLKEAYAYLNGRQQTRLIKFYDTIIKECNLIINTKKRKK